MTTLAGAGAVRRARLQLSPLMGDRLLRRGSVLTASSAITSVVGLAYWTLAAHSYSPSDVGRNSAAISAMMFLGGVAALNLMSALVRFLPVAGRSTLSLVRTVYVTSLGTAFVVSTGFLALLGWVAPSLRILVSTPSTEAWFVVSTMLWTVFVLQDSILTGLNRTWLVPAENAVYAVGKLALLVALATLLPRLGIFVSWTAALVITVGAINAFLFCRAIPSHQKNAAPDRVPPAAAEIRRFAMADYGGALMWMAAVNLLPLVVLDLAGPGATGVFSVAWVIAYSLYLVSGNMGISLVVESAARPQGLEERFNRLVAQTLKLLLPVVAALVVAAPVLLRFFGSVYSGQATTVLRLLLISAVPNVVTATAVATMRARSKAGLATLSLAILSAMVFSLSVVLVPTLGINGIGVAWLLSQCLVAAGLLVTRSSWLRGEGPVTAALAVVPQVLRSRVGSPILDRRRRARLVARSLPHALSAVQPQEGMPHPDSWANDTPPLRSFSDVSVAAIGPKGAAPVAVMKVSASPAATEDLRANARVLAALRSDARLAGWISVVPTVLGADLDGEQAYVIESHSGGVDGRTLRWDDARVARVAFEAASEVIGELGKLSGREAVLDDDWLQVWVDAPAEQIASLFPADDWRGASLDRLSSEIRDDLLGQPATLGWIHGDYTPGNVLMAADGTTVRGVVDWGSGSPSGIVPLDLGLLILGTRIRAERRELGSVIIDLVDGTSLRPGEVEALTAGGPDATPRTLLLLCWLNHISNNLRKADLYRRHVTWRRRNIDAVLRRLGDR